MPIVSLSGEGAEQFFALARRLKEAADKDLQRELYRGLNRAAKPLTAAVRQSALNVLPRAGKYNVTISAETKIKLQRRTGARSVGIKLIATATTATGKARELVKLDQGKLRHPLFGNRGYWYAQRVTPGWFSKPTEASGPAVREQLLIAMKNVADKIEG